MARVTSLTPGAQVAIPPEPSHCTSALWLPTRRGGKRAFHHDLEAWGWADRASAFRPWVWDDLRTEWWEGQKTQEVVLGHPVKGPAPLP